MCCEQQLRIKGQKISCMPYLDISLQGILTQPQRVVLVGYVHRPGVCPLVVPLHECQLVIIIILHGLQMHKGSGA